MNGLSCEIDFNVDESDFDVEYEETEALCFHETLFIRMNRR